MQTLYLTLPTPEENLALDEALLDEAEERAAQGAPHETREVLRIWEPDSPFVVLGRSSRLEEEVDLAACRALGIPVLRRSSGGATIVAGPGCLMYAVVLGYDRNPHLRAIDQAHHFVLQRLVAAVGSAIPGVAKRGTSDLALGDRKVSGNSLRCKRQHLLYHGTLLYDFPLSLVGELLKTPPRQPNYRHKRSHRESVTNLPLTAHTLRELLSQAWQATTPYAPWPEARTRTLVAERYGTERWNVHYP